MHRERVREIVPMFVTDTLKKKKNSSSIKKHSKGSLLRFTLNLLPQHITINRIENYYMYIYKKKH